MSIEPGWTDTAAAEQAPVDGGRPVGESRGSGRSRSWPLVGLLGAHAISLTGNMLMLIALPLYVLARTGSAERTGLAGVFVTLPVVVGGLLGGVLVDRFGYRRSSVAADLSSGTVIALVPVLGHSTGLPFAGLLGLVFVSGLLDSPGQNARIALLPEVAQAAGVPIERAIGWLEAAERGARLAGAPVAGLLVVAIGALNVLALDAATFGISAVLVLTLVPAVLPAVSGGVPEPDAEPRDGGTGENDEPRGVSRGEVGHREDGEPRESVREAVDEEVTGYWRQLRQGLRFVAAEPLLRAVVLLVVVTNLFDSSYSGVLLPVYADRRLGGAVAFGLLVGVMGGGSVAGSLLFGVFGHRLPRRVTFIAAFTLAGPPIYLALGAGVPLAGLLAIKLVSGFCSGAVNPILGIVELERTPVRMRARVFGLVNAGCYAAMPLGSLLAGAAIGGIGLTGTLFVVGTCYLVAALSPLRGGPWRGLNSPAAGTVTA